MYMAKGESGIKIGATFDVSGRIMELRRRHPGLVLVAYAKSSRFMMLERCLHIYLDPYGIGGEWYYDIDETKRGFLKVVKDTSELWETGEVVFVSPAQQMKNMTNFQYLG